MDPVFDFHTHTVLSDGELSVVELIRRAIVNGYVAIGITDHVGWGDAEEVVPALVKTCDYLRRYWSIAAVPGVELTHLPPAAIAEAARNVRTLGAQLVVVHGETPVEPVEPGTNRAAILCEEVDVLGHPGLLTAEDARLAAETGTYLEVSSRRGHSLANGRVVALARAAGARLVLDSDSHAPQDLLTASFARTVARGAGLEEHELDGVLSVNPRSLLAKLGVVLKETGSPAIP